MTKKEIDAQMVYLFVNQFDSFTSFLIQDKDILKEDMEEYLITILKDNRGKNGKINIETKTTEESIPLGIPMETTVSESVTEMME